MARPELGNLNNTKYRVESDAHGYVETVIEHIDFTGKPYVTEERRRFRRIGDALVFHTQKQERDLTRGRVMVFGGAVSAFAGAIQDGIMIGNQAIDLRTAAEATVAVAVGMVVAKAGSNRLNSSYHNGNMADEIIDKAILPTPILLRPGK